MDTRAGHGNGASIKGKRTAGRARVFIKWAGCDVQPIGYVTG